MYLNTINKEEEGGKSSKSDHHQQQVLDRFGRLIGEVVDEMSGLIKCEVTTSVFQNDVQHVAESMGLCCHPEQDDGPFVLDMVIVPTPESAEKVKNKSSSSCPPPHLFSNLPLSPSPGSFTNHIRS